MHVVWSTLLITKPTFDHRLRVKEKEEIGQIKNSFAVLSDIQDKDKNFEVHNKYLWDAKCRSSYDESIDSYRRHLI